MGFLIGLVVGSIISLVVASVFILEDRVRTNEKIQEISKKSYEGWDENEEFEDLSNWYEC